MANVTLYKGDCLEMMKLIPDGSVDLVLADPPYGTMKGASLDGWENKTTKWDIAIEPVKIFEQISRVLRPNGKAVLFSQEPYTSRLITSAIPSLPFCYRAIWYKNVHANALLAKNAMVNRYEDICVFAKPCPKYDRDFEDPARKYLMGEFEKCGFKKAGDVNKYLQTSTTGGGMASHYFAKGFQFSIPTFEKYVKLQETGFFSMPYSELKKIHDIFQGELTKNILDNYPAVFNLWQGGKSKPNVLEYAKDNDGYHPTQKPVKLLEDLIQTYSNDGNTVLDFTMGSGSTGVSCMNTSRNFIGIELDDGYFNIAKQRIEEAEKAVNK